MAAARHYTLRHHGERIILGILLVACVADMNTQTTTVNPKSRKYCGQSLVKILKYLCVEYNTPFSDADIRRHKRGVADECCRGHCSLETLSSYCRVARNITDEEEELTFNLVTQAPTAAPPSQLSTEKNLEMNIGEPEIFYVDLYTGPLMRISPYYSTSENCVYYNHER